MVLKGDGFFISYNPNTTTGHIGFTELANTLGGDVKDGEETALCVAGSSGLLSNTWHILEGDFRKEYEAAYPSLKKCLAVYKKHKKKHRSNWSTD